MFLGHPVSDLKKKTLDSSLIWEKLRTNLDLKKNFNNINFRICLSYVTGGNIGQTGYSWVLSKKIQPIRSSRLNGYGEHLNERLVLLYRLLLTAILYIKCNHASLKKKIFFACFEKSSEKRPSIFSNIRHTFDLKVKTVF